MKPITLALLTASILVSVALTSNAQTDGPPGPCQQAATWHLHQAMRFSQHDDQDFHLGAAQAAGQLAALGDDCNGWEQDATRIGPNGDGSATQADQAQAQMAVGK